MYTHTHILIVFWLQQSGRGELFIMYKKGSANPILDIRSTPPTHCSHCYAVSTPHAIFLKRGEIFYVTYIHT